MRVCVVVARAKRQDMRMNVLMASFFAEVLGRKDVEV